MKINLRNNQSHNLFYLVFVIIVIFVLAGCTSTQQQVVEMQYVCADGSIVNSSAGCVTKNVAVVQQKQVESQQVAETQEVIDQQTKQEEYTFSLQEIRDLDKKLIGKRAVFLRDSIDTAIQVGDDYVFAYAIKNEFVKPTQFKIDIQFLEAKTLSQGRIGADEKTEQWFRKVDGMMFNLSKDEVKYIPIYLTVGEYVNEQGLQTFDGTYSFDLVVYAQQLDEEGNFKDKYTSNRFYVRVGK